MPVKFKHTDQYSMYFCTFTCYNWMPLIDKTNSYDLVYNWFGILRNEQIEIVAYVIMPNHLHCILYFHTAGFDLNKLIGNAKRFMAYEIINRLEAKKDFETLTLLRQAVTEREKKKG